jgi:hypothetical protein
VLQWVKAQTTQLCTMLALRIALLGMLLLASSLIARRGPAEHEAACVSVVTVKKPWVASRLQVGWCNCMG